MPVSKSAKKALSVSIRRKSENLLTKTTFKRAIKNVRKAVADGTTEVASLFSQAQSALDTAAKSKAIHPNKAARLKSRLAKKLAAPAETPAPKKTRAKSTAKKTATSKKTTKKA